VTIEEKLYAILTTSPSPVPTLGLRVFPNTAAQGSPFPYCVYMQVSDTPRRSMEGDVQDMRQWRFQFSVFSPSFSAGKAIRSSLTAFLVGYTDRPATGIQRIIELNQRYLWIETQRLHQFVLDVDIAESLPGS